MRKRKGRVTNGCWLPQYEDYLREVITETSAYAVGPAPSDIAEVCPNYESLSPSQRQDFWVYFFQALAATESMFDKYVQLEEEFLDTEGKPVLSQGLLQLSYSDRRRGMGCRNFSKEQDAGKPEAERTIFDAKNNLQCGASILKGMLFEGVGEDAVAENSLFYRRSYWAPLRKNAKFKRRVDECVAKSDGSEAAILGCQGLYSRRLLGQFWEGYPIERSKTGKNLCGLRNHLEFCGSVQCVAAGSNGDDDGPEGDENGDDDRTGKRGITASPTRK